MKWEAERKGYTCNDCYLSMQNCHDMNICCEDETGLCDYFEEIPDMRGNRNEQTQWIPVNWYYHTDKERKEFEFSEEKVIVFDCEIPDDEQEILMTTEPYTKDMRGEV